MNDQTEQPAEFSRCDGCDKELKPDGYFILVDELPAGSEDGYAALFCSWCCAVAILDVLADKEQQAELAKIPDDEPRTAREAYGGAEAWL